MRKREIAVRFGLKKPPKARMKNPHGEQNADTWKSFGKRTNKKKDYKHLVGSDKPLKGKKHGKK